MRASQLVVCGRCDWDKGRSPGRREEKGKLCIESPKRPMQQSQQPIQSMLRVHLNEKPSRLCFQVQIPLRCVTHCFKSGSTASLQMQ